MINTTTGEISNKYIEYLRVLVHKVKNLILLSECEIENLLSLKVYREKARRKIVDVVKLSFLQLAPSVQKKLINTIDLNDKEFLKTILLNEGKILEYLHRGFLLLCNVPSTDKSEVRSSV